MAMFTDTKKSETQTLTAGTLSATFTGNGTIQTELVPIADTDVATKAGTFTFTLTNNGTLPMSYTITIFNKAGITNPLEHKYIKIQYDSDSPTYLNALQKVDSGVTDENQVQYILKESSIEAGASGSPKTETHTIKIWIADKDNAGVETGTDIVGKSIGLSIGLSGTVKEN